MNVSNTLNCNTREVDPRIITQEWDEKESYKERKDALLYGGPHFMPDVHDVKIDIAAYYDLFFTQGKIGDHMNCLAYLKEKIERRKKCMIANVQKADQFISDSIKTVLGEFFTQEKIDCTNWLAYLKEKIERRKKCMIANVQKADQFISDSIKTVLGEFYTKEEAKDFKYSAHSKDKSSVTRIRRTKELDSLVVIRNKWTLDQLPYHQEIVEISNNDDVSTFFLRAQEHCILKSQSESRKRDIFHRIITICSEILFVEKQSQNLNSDMFKHIPGTIDWMNEASMNVQLSTLPKTNTEEMPKENRRVFWCLTKNFISIYNEFEECSMILTSFNSDLDEKNKFGTQDYDGSDKNNNHEHTEFLFHKRIKQNKSKPWYSSYFLWAVTLSIKARVSLEELEAALNVLHKLPTVTLVSNFDVLLPEQRILRQKRPSLSEYFERLHSFLLGQNNRNKIWNNDKFVWPGPLVAAGFSYEGEDDIVVCKYCKCWSDTTRWTDNNESYALRMHKEGKQGRCRFLEVFGGD